MRPTRKPVEPDRDEGAVRVETTKPTAVPGHDHQRIALAGAPPVNKPLGTRPPGFDVASSQREQAGSTDFPLAREWTSLCPALVPARRARFRKPLR